MACQKAKCARSHNTNERKKNYKMYLDDLCVHTMTHNIPTAGVGYFGTKILEKRVLHK